MTDIFGTTYTLEQYDAAPIDWTVSVSDIYLPGRTLAPSAQTYVTLNIIPVSPPWPTNPTIQNEGAVLANGGFIKFVTQPSYVTVTTCRATENPDGSGASYDLLATASPSRADLYGVYGEVGTSANPDLATLVGLIANPTDHTLYLQEMTGTFVRFASIGHYQTVVTPPITGVPPPPTNLPPAVVQRKLLDAANPGFNCEIERDNRYEDMVGLFLGQKVALTVNGVLGRLGIVNRSHVVTRLRFRWQARAGGNAPTVALLTTATLEKIPGTLLPGAGTSGSDLDAAGDGADARLFAAWDTAGAGWGAAWSA